MENQITKLDIAFKQDFVACCEQLAGQKLTFLANGRDRTVLVYDSVTGLDDWLPRWIESGQVVVTIMTWAEWLAHQKRKLSQALSE